jgi:DNA repair protein RecO (recombination protein O)
LETFTREHGRIALLAKGAKRPSSNFRPVLMPLQPLSVSYGGDSEVRTLKGAEWLGGHVMPTGEGLLAGYYANELILRCLPRDDPHPALFDVYAQIVQVLAERQSAVIDLALRAFELSLLREAGVLPDVSQTATRSSLGDGVNYTLDSQNGLRESLGSEPGVVGVHWRAIEVALKPESFNLSPLLRACEAAGPALKRILRQLLQHHLGVSALRTRQMLLDLKDIEPAT